MTVSTEISRVIVEGNAVTTTFSYTFPIPGSSATDQTNAELILLGTDSSITTLADNLWSITGVDTGVGGTFIYNPGTPLTTGAFLTLNRIVPYEQTTSLSGQGAYSATVVEAALDNLAFQTEQNNTRLLQSLRVPITDDAISDYPTAVERAGGYAGFDPTTGDALVLFGTPGSAIFVGTNSTSTSSVTTLLLTGPAVTSVTTAGGVATATFAGTLGITDGTHTVSAATSLTFANGTVSGSNPSATYTAPAGGSSSLVLVEHHTASASSSIAFTSGISSTYVDYVVKLVGITPDTTGSDILMEMSTNSGSTWYTASNYYFYTSLAANSGSVSFTGNPAAAFSLVTAQLNDTNGVPFNGTLDIFDPQSTTHAKGFTGQITGNVSGALFGGNWSGTILDKTTAFNAFRLRSSSGNISAVFAGLYGYTKT